jgi:hypothetical protein
MSCLKNAVRRSEDPLTHEEKDGDAMRRSTLVSVLAALSLAAASIGATAAAAVDPFSGTWTANDPGDGSTLRLQIGSASASGSRHVTITDSYGSICGALVTAIGTGTVSGSILTATVDIRCGGELAAEDIEFAFESVGDTLAGLGVTFVRTTRDAFTGAWAATDPFDGSALRLQIGSPSAKGVRQVTLTDDFASACGAPATAIGTGEVSGTTLTTVVDIRCGGELVAEDATIVYQLSGNALTDGFSTFTRTGA